MNSLNPTGEDPDMLASISLLSQNMDLTRFIGKTREDMLTELQSLEQRLESLRDESLRRYDLCVAGFASDMRLGKIKEQIHEYRLFLKLEVPPYNDEEKKQILANLPRTLAELIRNNADEDFWTRMQEEEKQPGYIIYKHKTLQIFNEAGTLSDEVKRTYYDNDHNSFDWTHYEYDPKGTILKKTEQYYDSSGRLSSIKVEIYKKGEMIEAIDMSDHSDGSKNFYHILCTVFLGKKNVDEVRYSAHSGSVVEAKEVVINGDRQYHARNLPYGFPRTLKFYDFFNQHKLE